MAATGKLWSAPIREQVSPASRVFANCRVSTAGQTTPEPITEIEAAGFKVDGRRVVSETVPGSSAIEQRPRLLKLLDRMEAGDVLIVTELYRLGRSAIDVTRTEDRHAKVGVRIHCLTLGGANGKVGGFRICQRLLEQASLSSS